MDPVGESWREILAPQALDLVLLTAFLTLAMVSFFRKSVWLKYVTFVASVGYMGFMKSSLVSISDVFRLTDLSVPPFKYTPHLVRIHTVRRRDRRSCGDGSTAAASAPSAR